MVKLDQDSTPGDKKPQSVLASDSVNNVDDNIPDRSKVAPAVSNNLRPSDLLFQHDTIGLVAGTPQVISCDGGADEYVIYVPSSLTTTISVSFSLGGYIDPSHRFDINIAIGGQNQMIRLPAQMQQLAFLAITNNAVIVLAQLANCDFFIS